MDVSVAICTYNGADRIPEVLDHLLVQQGVDEVRWEVIVVDNNSSDDTKDVVRHYQPRWLDDVPLRYGFERRQGKSYAMERAVETARGTWVAFLDDDNLPEPEWIAEAVAFSREHPGAGAFGGQVHGLFDQPPPSTFGLVQPLFAINERTDAFCYTAEGTMTFGAPGAGLWVRRKAWEQSVPEGGLSQKGTISDGRGEVGEDLEIQWHLFENGWDIWHNPIMHVHHKIPAHRFDKEYLRSFFKAIGQSRHHLRMLSYQPWQQPAATIVYLLGDLARLLRLVWMYPSKVFSDRFVRGRAAMRFHMLKEPFRSSK
jgi:glycosyltransferase involved in cell wall biosynthesis